jgi:hypothetical protein
MENKEYLSILFLVVFTFVLSTVVISQNIRLHWWVKNDKQDVNNGPQDWATWMASAFIAVTSIIFLYYSYIIIKPLLI